jgi:hypothetical protein
VQGATFAAAWGENLGARDGRFAALTSDQQVFNAMVRAPDGWPGIKPAAADPSRLLAPAGGGFSLGVFPVAQFRPGHVHFVQHAGATPEAPTVAVHATYTFDGALSSLVALHPCCRPLRV